jgi:hypothetical protein
VSTLVLQFSTSDNRLSNWASAAIRRLNHSPFSHIDAILPHDDRWPDGSCLGASDQGPHSPCIIGNPEGVAVRPPNYQGFGYRRQMILQTDRADDVVAKIMNELGKPFDSSALWEFLGDDFPSDKIRDWRNPDRWFCAEIKAAKLEDGGFFPHTLPWPKNRVSPTDLLLVLLMDERWINRDTFWQPIPGLPLGPGEK